MLAWPSPCPHADRASPVTCVVCWGVRCRWSLARSRNEEQIALPLLGLVAPLARGAVPRAMRAMLPLTVPLRAELPKMLGEHKALHESRAIAQWTRARSSERPN